MSSTTRTLITWGFLSALWGWALVRKGDDVRDRHAVQLDQPVERDAGRLDRVIGVIGRAEDGGQGSLLAQVALCELDQLGVLVAAGEDDDHDLELRLLPLLACHRGWAGARTGTGLGGLDARSTDLQHPPVLQG